MPIDPYGLCPCGSGKKLKFCCHDLIHEMEKIQRMLEGQQRAACLAHVKGLLAKHSDRASLLGLAAMLELDLEQFDDARQTLATFTAAHPDNPVALAETAILAARTGEGPAAVAPLHQALGTIGREMPSRVYQAVGEVADGLLQSGQLMAARAHLLLQAMIGKEQDPRPARMLMQLNRAPQIPLALKDDYQLLFAPAGAPWKDAFDRAVSLAAPGRWQAARAGLEALIPTVGDAPALWWNLAILRAWLADEPGMLEALRKYAALDVPRDDAVEALALAMLLDTSMRDERLDVVSQAYAVADVEALEGALRGSERVVEVPAEQVRPPQEGEPPARSGFVILDRPVPASGVDLPLADVPLAVARVVLFGRQTDRDARLELVATRNDQYEAAGRSVVEAGGAALGATEGEPQVIGEMSRTQDALQWSWRLPPDTPDAHYEALLDAKRREAILERFPEVPLPSLGEKTLHAAAADPNLVNECLAVVLLLEMSADDQERSFDTRALREQLGLPIDEPVDPATFGARRVPLVRLGRIAAEKLSDEQLITCYRRAAVMGARGALEPLAAQVVARESVAEQLDQAEAYGILAELEEDLDRASDHIHKARAIAESRGESSAAWDLAELAIELDRGNGEAARQLFEHIRSDHFQEPGVREELAEILVAAGVINPDGSPVAPAAQAESELVVPSGGGEPGQIWTPDSVGSGDKRVSPGGQGEGGQPSKLWVPE